MAPLTFFIIVARWQGMCGHGSLPGFLGKWGGERGSGVAGEQMLLLPLPRASRGRRRPTVPF